MMATAKKATKKATRKAATRKTAPEKASAIATETAPVDNLVVASKVKDAIRAGDMRMSAELPDALTNEVQHLIDRAIQRARDNGRGTVRPSDL